MSVSGPGTGGGGSKSDKNKSGSIAGSAGAGSRGYDKAVNPGNSNLGLSGPGYSGPRGRGTGVDPANPSNRATKGAEGSSGTQSSPQPPQKNLPTGVTPLTKPKPMGATPFVEGADLLGIGTRIFAGIPGAVMSGLTQAVTGEDPTQSMLGEHLGKQTGWSADPSMTSGRDRAQRGTSNRESFDQTNLGSPTGTERADDGTTTAASTDKFSDIQLADRRKPNLKQMLETML